MLAAERLQSDEPAQFWGNLVGLLYVGAAAADAEAAEKVRPVLRASRTPWKI